MRPGRLSSLPPKARCSSPADEEKCSDAVFQSRYRIQLHCRIQIHRYIHQGRPGLQSYHNSSHPYPESESGNPCRNNIQLGDSQCYKGHWIDRQHSGVTKGYSVLTRQGIKSNYSNLSHLPIEKHRTSRTRPLWGRISSDMSF